MTFSTVEIAFFTRWKTLIELAGDALGAAIVSIYPESGRKRPSSGLHARVSIRYGNRERVDFGSTSVRRREVGVFFAEVFDDPGKSLAAINAVGDRIKVAFESKGFGGVVTHDVNRQNAGDEKRSGRWARGIFAVPFFFDDVS